MKRAAHMAFLAWLVGCSQSTAHDKSAAATSPDRSAPSPADRAGTARSSPSAEPALGVPVALVTDPAALAVVSAAGGSFDARLSVASRQAIVRAVASDVTALDRADSKAGVGIRGNAHRLFDKRWLANGRFELVGLAYRIDRIPVTGERCGDIRLVYRLAYSAQVSGETVSSRLPMTVLAVLPGPPARPGGDCSAAARSWLASESLSGAELGQWLVDGPLGQALADTTVAQVLVNYQLVRWPSAVRPDLGGHAEYVLRAFVPGPDHLVEGPLDNTPDVDGLRGDRDKRDRLLAWIKQPHNLAAIADGSAALPLEFRARKAVSVAPRGLARRANRPYRQLFGPEDFADLDLVGKPIIGSPAALLRRLDDMTCVGCHQSRTIAGFHLLGEDGPDVAAGNALAVSISAPLVAEVERRQKLLAAIARVQPVDFTRPMTERAPGDPGTDGDRCGLGDAGFADWTCAEGFECRPGDVPADDAAVGYCMARGPVPLGGACELGPIKPHRNAHRDRTTAVRTLECDRSYCNGNRVGFPGGMCTASCEDLPDSGTCGVIALLTPFNNCLARKTPFPRCLAEHVAPAGMRSCSLDRPCREDYICARTPSGSGACIPPYFLFQMRVDGHP